MTGRGWMAALALMASALATGAHALPVCKWDALKALPFAGDIKPVEPYTPYVVAYPAGSRKAYGFDATFAIDAGGRVTCATIDRDEAAEDDAPPEITPQRQAWLDHLAETVFQPHVENGKATPVYTWTFPFVHEEQLPKYHVVPPRGDLAGARIHQDSTIMSIPGADMYSVDITGDGRVIYKDLTSPAVGTQAYRIEPSDVQALLDTAADIDFWSYDDAMLQARPYAQGLLHCTTITYGEHSNGLGYLGDERGGMPKRIIEFQRKIERTARVDWWETLPPDLLKQMQENGFDFKGPRGAAFLSWAMRHQRPEDGIRRLLALGIPVAWAPPGPGGLSDSPLIAALQTRYTDLAMTMLDHGALLKGGKPDRVRVNTAFVAAISGGTMAGMHRIAPLHPDMTGPDPEAGDLTGLPPVGAFPPRSKPDFQAAKARVPVIFWLPDYHAKPDQAAITEWLLAHGTSANARNARKQSILSYAATRSQTDIVKILLAHGASPNALDKDDLAPLPESWDEDLTLMLLDAGADPRKLDADAAFHLYWKLNKQDWQRVRNWLDAHGYADWVKIQADHLDKARSVGRSG